MQPKKVFTSISIVLLLFCSIITYIPKANAVDFNLNWSVSGSGQMYIFADGDEIPIGLQEGAGARSDSGVLSIPEGMGIDIYAYADPGYIPTITIDGNPWVNNEHVFFGPVESPYTVNVTFAPSSKIQYSDLAVSDTLANKTVTLSVYAIGYENNLSQAVWSTNNSGVWAALDAIAFSGSSGWANATLTLNQTVGQKIGYRCNITDTAANLNATIIQALTTTGYYITASNDTYSLLSPNGQVAVCAGGSQQFNFSATAGHTIASVIKNGTETLSTTSPYVFTNVQGNQTLAVSTSSIIYYVNATSDDGCTVTPTGLLSVPDGTWANFTFNAKIGYQLAALYINGSEVNSTNTYGFIPTGNTTIHLTSTDILTGQPSGGGGGSTTIVLTPVPLVTETPDPEKIAANNFYMTVGAFALILTFGIPIFLYTKKEPKKKRARSWNDR